MRGSRLATLSAGENTTAHAREIVLRGRRADTRRPQVRTRQCAPGAGPSKPSAKIVSAAA
jgi:hypothetical protein